MNLVQDLKKILFEYGTENQKNKTIEELAELIQALSKPIIICNRKDIIKELADVEIMLLQLKMIFVIEKYEIDAVKEIKIEKVLQKIRRNN